MLDTFDADWPYALGVLGVQEAAGALIIPLENGVELQLCGTHAVECISRMDAGRHSRESTVAQAGPLGIVAGDPWKVVRYSWHRLGIDTPDNPLARPNPRDVLVALVQHKDKPELKFHFFTVHLSADHGDQGTPTYLSRRADRVAQIAALLTVVGDSVQSGELPPIMVGDFNTAPYDFEASVVAPIFTEFMLANSEPIADPNGCINHAIMPEVDHIWIGRPERFPLTRGSYTIVRHHGPSRKGLGVVAGFDHEWPAVSLRIER
jgi:hypothetical protein